MKVNDLAAAAGVKTRDYTRSAKRHALHITMFTKGRSDEAKKAVQQCYQEFCEIAQRSVHQVKRVQEALRENTSRKAQKFVTRCTALVPIVEKVISQTRRRIVHQKEVPSVEKVTSLHEPTTEILRCGKRAKPTEFGHMVKVQEVDGGIISDIAIVPRAVGDVNLLIPAVEHHIQQFGSPPTHLAADRGFSSSDNERDVTQLGVKYIGLPARGTLSVERQKHERQRWFTKLNRFRVGAEATISRLKRSHGMRRSLYKGDAGFTCWVYLAAIACDLAIIARRLIT